MIQVYWQDQLLDVRRLVFRRGHEAAFDAALDGLATRFHLEVADDRADPHPGDFWIGCHPRTGWGPADANRIGWASLVEVPLAVGVLHRTAAETGPPVDLPPLTAPSFAIALSCSEPTNHPSTDEQ